MIYNKIKTLAIALIPVLISEAQTTVFNETFQNVTGSEENPALASMADFDNPAGWELNGIYAGPGYLLLEKGSSITLPAIDGLSGNATLSISLNYWEKTYDWDSLTPDEITQIESDRETPHPVSISHGTLSETSISEFLTTSGKVFMYGVSSESRVTLTASHPVRLTSACIQYGNGDWGIGGFDNIATFSHPSREYYEPFELEITYNSFTSIGESESHCIPLYTLDGTTPTRNSPQYTGPITISKTTTVIAGLILGDGSIIHTSPQTYTFQEPSTPQRPDNTYELTVTTPGGLKSQILDIEGDIIEGLTLHGRINGADLAYICGATGRMSQLSYLDISDVSFEYDGTTYATIINAPEAGMGTVYTYSYIFSETNYDETVATGNPGSETYNYYRNDLSAAFNKNTSLTTVFLPEWMTSIGESIFAGCKELVYVGIPSDITSVGDSAFSGCSKLGNHEWMENLTVIGANAFNSARVPGKLAFNRNVMLGESAFSYTNVRSVDMPYPPETLPWGLFNGSELETIHIGEGCKTLESRSLYANNLIEADLPATLDEIKSEVLYEYCPYVKNLPADNNICYIGKIAFKVADTSQTHYDIKEGTVSLGDNLFRYSSINTVALPSSLEKIGTDCFAYTQLTSIDLPDNTREIGSGAFSHTQLSRITIPENVTYLGNSICQDCNSLWSVTYNAIYAEGDHVLIGTNSGWNPNNLERIVIGDKVKRLPSGIFTYNKNVTEVALPESLQVIGDGAFEGCSNLVSVKMPDSVTEIGDYAFGYCSQLSDVHWPLNLRTVGDRTFRECALKTVSLPEGLKTLEYGAFQQCDNVERLYIPSTIEEIGYGALPIATNITCTALTPPDYEWGYGCRDGVSVVKVPYESLSDYKNSTNWNRYMADKITAIEEITASAENNHTDFSSGIDETTDLGDAVVGNIYITLSEDDRYDESDGSIVLNSTMTESEVEAIGGMSPGKTDIANRFNGLVTIVGGGWGNVTIGCQTFGENRLNVKIGDNAPEIYTKDIKGDITFDYDVEEPTYVYIYGSTAETSQQAPRKAENTTANTTNCVKIYSIGINPVYSRIGNITERESTESPVTDYYTIDGRRTESPTKSGIYIVRRADGTTSKIAIRK